MLEVRDLTVEFQTSRGVVHAVNEVGFDVPSGSIVGLVGETGSGKSATVRALIRLIRPPGRVVSGSVRLNDVDVLSLSPRKLRATRGGRIGFVGQNPFAVLNPVLTIERQFRNVIRAHRRASKREIRELAEAQLRSIGIAGPRRVLDGYPHELSGGMAQRVVIALALALGPELIIADEPTTALDVTVQRQILDLMRTLVTGGRSMLLVTHDLGVVAQYCDYVLVMYAGRLVETGRVAEVFARPAHPYTLGLLQSIPDAENRLKGIPGSVPDLVNYPAGCPFSARCAFAFGRCATELPRLRVVAGGRQVSCHLEAGVSCHLEVGVEEKQVAAAGPQ